MLTMPKLVLIGAGVVITFDAIASLASKWLGFAYPKASIGSVAIYAGLGYVGYRFGGLRVAMLTALAVGLVDATLGWSVSWAIGPGAVPPPKRTASVLALSGAFAIGVDLIAAVLGVAAARLVVGLPEIPYG
jgi:hypothetical protein